MQMLYLGEMISLFVAFSWTATALFADKASHRIGSLSVNVFRMLFSLVLLSITLWIFSGHPYPAYADGATWFWLALSGFVGYVFGDYCLFNSYVLIGSRFGQLFMTLSPIAAAVSGRILLGESMAWTAWVAMLVTISGIALTILTRGEGGSSVKLKLPLKGVLLGIGAGTGQGVGLVLSKMGMNHYELCVPSEVSDSFAVMLPFASTFIRAVVGAAGFLAMMALTGSFTKLRDALHDRKGMAYTTAATITGPFIGVSLSLMAVRFTDAGIASTLMALTPVLIIWPHSLIYKQKISAKEVFGTVVSIIGVAMFFLF